MATHTLSQGNSTKDEIAPLNENKSQQEIKEEKEEIKDDNNINIDSVTEIVNDNNNKCKCDECPILHPYGAFKICWDLIVSIVIIISAIEIPLTMAFDIPVDFTTNIGIMSFCIDIFLCCDICVTFRTAYFDEWDPLRLIINPKVIALRYAKGWFTFDFLTSFPFNFVFSFTNSDATDEASRGIKVLRIVRLFRLLRVFRIYKMLGIMREMNRLFPTLKKWFGISQVMIFMLFVAHYFACLWFSVGKVGQRDELDSWLDHQEPPIIVDDNTYNVNIAYSTSFYWSVVTLFTTGYGDITAHNSMEQWVAIFVIVVGSIMTAYLVGTLTVLAFEGDKQSQYLQDKLDEAFSFGTYFGLSNPLIRAITAHIEYHCRYNYVYGDPHTFLRSLPQHLRDKVESEVSGKAISKIDFLDGLPQHIVGNINITLKKIACNENTVLYSEGHRSTTMYLLRIGCAVLFYGKDSQNYEKKVRILKRGDICGETCLVSEKRLNTLRCETWCEFYVLQKEDIHDILFDHYDADIADEWWQNIKQTVQKNMTKQRKVKFPETNREKKAKSKLDNDWNDSVYDDLYSCDNATNAGFIQTRPSQMGIKPDVGGVGGVGDIDEPDIVQRENVSGLVDRMRDMSRVDSGYKDFKMKQHYKFLHDKDEEIQNNKLSSSSSDTIQLTQHNTAHNIVSIAEDNEL